MEDVFKTNDGDWDAEIKKLHEKIETNKQLFRSSALKLAKVDIDKFVYHTVRDKVNEENRAFEYKIAELKKLENN